MHDKATGISEEWPVHPNARIAALGPVRQGRYNIYVRDTLGGAWAEISLDVAEQDRVQVSGVEILATDLDSTHYLREDILSDAAADIWNKLIVGKWELLDFTVPDQCHTEIRWSSTSGDHNTTTLLPGNATDVVRRILAESLTEATLDAQAFGCISWKSQPKAVAPKTVSLPDDLRNKLLWVLSAARVTPDYPLSFERFHIDSTGFDDRQRALVETFATTTHWPVCLLPHVRALAKALGKMAAFRNLR
jgi:hypothetical protein